MKTETKPEVFDCKRVFQARLPYTSTILRNLQLRPLCSIVSASLRRLSSELTLKIAYAFLSWSHTLNPGADSSERYEKRVSTERLDSTLASNTSPTRDDFVVSSSSVADRSDKSSFPQPLHVFSETAVLFRILGNGTIQLKQCVAGKALLLL